MDFVKYLKQTKNKIHNDKLNFENYAKGENIDAVLNKFILNNKIPIEITREDFEKWLNSLGYRREE